MSIEETSNEIIEVILDYRNHDKIKEIISVLINDHKFKNLRLFIEKLEVGDIVTRTKTLIGNLCIELKRGIDYYKSVIDGRFFNEILNMSDNFDLIFIITIGTYYELGITEENRDAMIAALAAAGTKYGCQVFNVPTEYDAILLSLSLIAKANTLPRMKPIVKPNISGQERQKASIQCIPGIGQELSNRLLKVWSIKEIANITDPKTYIDNVSGIGKKKATEIIKFFNDANY